MKFNTLVNAKIKIIRTNAFQANEKIADYYNY